MTLRYLFILLLACGSPAVAQQMQYPLAVAAAQEGPLYVADLRLPGIWKVTDGVAAVYYQGQKTFRTPLNAVRCLAFDQNGRLLAGDSATREVYRFDETGQPQPLCGGAIGIPAALAVNSEGTIFVADLEASRIWTLPTAGGEPTEFALIAGCRGLAFDAEGRLWAVATTGAAVRRFASDGTAETIVAGDVFQLPHQIALLDGTAYITDNYAKTLWKLEPNGSPTALLQGPPLVSPVGLAARQGKLLVADPHARAIFAVTPTGEVSTLIAAEQ